MTDDAPFYRQPIPQPALEVVVDRAALGAYVAKP